MVNLYELVGLGFKVLVPGVYGVYRVSLSETWPNLRFPKRRGNLYGSIVIRTQL